MTAGIEDECLICGAWHYLGDVCSSCGCDFYSIMQVRGAKLNPWDIHDRLTGRPGYHGINDHSVDLIIATFSNESNQPN